MINITTLSAVGLYFFAHIVTVDINQWDHMTVQEIITSIPKDYWESYKTFLYAEPIKAKAMASCTAYLFGDILSQLTGGKKVGQIDRWRAVRAGAFGAGFHGYARHYYY